MQGEGAYRIAVCAHTQPLVAYAVEVVLSNYRVEQCHPDLEHRPAADADLVFQYGASTYCALDCSLCCGLPKHTPRVFMSLGWLETEDAVRRAGFHGYIGPSCSPAQVQETIAVVLRGGSLYHPGMRHVTAVCPLTERQVEVLRLVAMGFTDHEIAARIGVLPTTVRHHLEALQRKLDLTRRGELIALAALGGLKDDALAGPRPNCRQTRRRSRNSDSELNPEYAQTAESLAMR
ncbi:MAG: helix-turn-helix domain-containing protein [Armatimonadota bacterium]